MRVMLISEEYPPVGGGLGVSAKRIASQVVQFGIRPSVVTFDYVTPDSAQNDYTSYVAEHQDEFGTHVFRVGPFPTTFEGPERRNIGGTYRSFAAQCVRLARRLEPSVVHSFGAWNAGYVSAIVANQIRVPHILGVRGNDLGREIYNPNHYAALRFTFDSAAQIAFVSSGLARLSASVLGERVNSSIVRNGCDPGPLRPRQEVTALLGGLSTKQPTIGLFGDVREKKGVLEVIRATSCVARELRPSILIVGEPAREVWYARALAKAIDEATAAGVTVRQLGRVDRSTVLALMERCDVVVQASLDDGLPNTLLEAMVVGRPILASELFRDDFADECLEYCDPYAQDSVVEGLERLLRNPERRRILGLKAQRLALETFSPRLEASKYVALYRSAALAGEGSAHCL